MSKRGRWTAEKQLPTAQSAHGERGYGDRYFALRRRSPLRLLSDEARGPAHNSFSRSGFQSYYETGWRWKQSCANRSPVWRFPVKAIYRDSAPVRGIWPAYNPSISGHFGPEFPRSGTGNLKHANRLSTRASRQTPRRNRVGTTTPRKLIRSAKCRKCAVFGSALSCSRGLRRVGWSTISRSRAGISRSKAQLSQLTPVKSHCVAGRPTCVSIHPSEAILIPG